VLTTLRRRFCWGGPFFFFSSSTTTAPTATAVAVRGSFRHGLNHLSAAGRLNMGHHNLYICRSIRLKPVQKRWAQMFEYSRDFMKKKAAGAVCKSIACLRIPIECIGPAECQNGLDGGFLRFWVPAPQRPGRALPEPHIRHRSDWTKRSRWALYHPVAAGLI
jgi:hypothetical protein